MAKQKYALNPGEKIVFKVSCVRHGFWGAYTHALTITNQSVILENYLTVRPSFLYVFGQIKRDSPHAKHLVRIP